MNLRILYLDLDTLRPDHLGCYGYHRHTSPNIDRLAAQGLRFTNCYCSDAPCLPSRTALMTGRFGIHTGVVGHGGTAADMRIEGPDRKFRDRLGRESLPAILRSSGLKTVTISPFAERHSAWSFYAGFNEVYNTGKCGLESAEEITPTAMKWIQNNAKTDDWFLHLNYWDAHTPYRAPLDYGNPFAEEPLPAWLSGEVLAAHRGMVGPHKPLELHKFDSNTDPRFPRQLGAINDMNDLRTVIDGYDCGISYMDAHIGQVLNALADQGVLDDLAIVISADHGENMGELGIYSEHATADHATCRIPLIIRWPGGRQRSEDHDLHYHLDLAPTLAELLGKEPPPSWDGQSYARVITAQERHGRDYLVLSQCAHVCQRSVRFGPWLYIRTYHDGFHLFSQEMLFDVAADPHEEHDLSAVHPDRCREAAHLLNGWHDIMMTTSHCDIDPLWTVMREGGPQHAKGDLGKYGDYLAKTGRGHMIEELRRRHPTELV